MKAYIGTKIIKAVGMSKLDFERIYNGKDSEENADNESGYMVEYPDGYKSWSPSPTFEDAYREISDEEIQIINSTIPGESEQ